MWHFKLSQLQEGCGCEGGGGGGERKRLVELFDHLRKMGHKFGKEEDGGNRWEARAGLGFARDCLDRVPGVWAGCARAHPTLPPTPPHSDRSIAFLKFSAGGVNVNRRTVNSWFERVLDNTWGGRGTLGTVEQVRQAGVPRTHIHARTNSPHTTCHRPRRRFGCIWTPSRGSALPCTPSSRRRWRLAHRMTRASKPGALRRWRRFGGKNRRAWNALTARLGNRLTIRFLGRT